MLNPTTVMAEALGNRLEDYYRRTFGPEEPSYPGKLNLAAHMALEVIANSDALYHDVQHTMLVTLVGQEILRGRQMDISHLSLRLVCELGWRSYDHCIDNATHRGSN
jgi:hypothetical protein